MQTVPVVDPAFWNDLERHILDWEALPSEYLFCRRSVRPNRHKPGERFITEYRGEQMGVHGLHECRSTKRFMRLAGIEPATSRSGGARSIP